MALPNIFDPATTSELKKRIEQLNPMTQRRWGKMNVDQMLAHICVPYEQALGERNDGPNWFMKIMLRAFFKQSMVNEVPYRQNLPTAPAFMIVDRRDFEREKARILSYIEKIEKLGPEYFDGKEQISLGKLNTTEWNNLLYKHIDHHLRQFGV